MISAKAQAAMATFQNACRQGRPEKTKPKSRVWRSCGHQCPDGDTCWHLCCARTIRLSDMRGFDDFINSAPVLLQFLEAVPIEDLLRLRQTSHYFKDTIESMSNYKRAAFLMAETPQDPAFPASMLENMLRPISGNETDQERLLPLYEHSMENVPYRSVRVNPYILNPRPQKRFLASCDNPAHFSANGVDLRAILDFNFSPTDNRTLHDDSSCMDMFITQPPVKEVVVHYYQRLALHQGGVEHQRSPKKIGLLLTVDGDGVRFRDLFRVMNQHAADDDVARVITIFEKCRLDTRVEIPRCEALTGRGTPVFLHQDLYD